MGGVPPYLVLHRVGFALPAPLLSRRCALTAPFHPYPAHSCGSRKCDAAPARMSGAVCFLWHFPSSELEFTLPDVIRHTALRSSDFPPRPFSLEPRFFLVLRPEWAGRPSGPAAYGLIICDGLSDSTKAGRFRTATAELLWQRLRISARKVRPRAMREEKDIACQAN